MQPNDPRKIIVTFRREAGRWMILAAAIFLITIALPAALAAIGIVSFQTLGLIAPGVYAGGVPLGTTTVPMAVERLDQAWGQERMLTVSDGQRVWQVPAASFGLHLDARATAEEAYAIGRTPQGVSALGQLLTTGRIDIAPQVSFSVEEARSQLERLAAQIDIPPEDAVLSLENGQVSVKPGKPGTHLDVSATLARLAADPAAVLYSGHLDVPIITVTPRVNDLSAIQDEAQRLLDQPLKILVYDPITGERIPWNVPRDVLASALRVVDETDGPQIALDGEKVRLAIQAWGGSFAPARSFQSLPDAETVSADWREGRTLILILWHAPSTYSVQPGDTLIKIAWKVGMPMWKILAANPGLDANGLKSGQTLTIPSPNEMLPLPVVVDKRIVISISEQRLGTYQDGRLLDTYVISTGIDRSPTQPGVFQVQTHEPNAYASIWDLTMPNFLGIYEAWPGFMNGIHGLPMLSNGKRLWANVLGRPASYGCIILDLPASETVYNWADNGVVVEITP